MASSLSHTGGAPYGVPYSMLAHPPSHPLLMSAPAVPDNASPGEYVGNPFALACTLPPPLHLQPSLHHAHTHGTHSHHPHSQGALPPHHHHHHHHARGSCGRGHDGWVCYREV
mmetsp:Transcript_25494/g.63993  ORF Transcript_25494/g.63993 Transcript_25494/m.63993 type:complete len:113 (-) Transcript_25494:552-890(-)